jgi:hypothetical protein
MQPVGALKVILALSVFGTVFAAVQVYQEVFGTSAAACPAVGAPGTLLGYPACVYGLFVFAAIAFAAGFGLHAASRLPIDVSAEG